jgi:hypothetical protein
VRDDGPGLATGALLVLIGAWVVSRTLVHDAQGKNLVDRIVAYSKGGSTSSGRPVHATTLGKLGVVPGHDPHVVKAPWSSQALHWFLSPPDFSGAAKSLGKLIP